jgi:divalent metal cation (Fe/Co/Zn/Cd) transporter
VSQILGGNPQVLFYHKVKVLSQGEESRIDMHIVIDADMSVSDSHLLSHKIKELLEKKLSGCTVSTHIEPCDGECESCPGFCEDE